MREGAEVVQTRAAAGEGDSTQRAVTIGSVHDQDHMARMHRVSHGSHQQENDHPRCHWHRFVCRCCGCGVLCVCP